MTKVSILILCSTFAVINTLPLSDISNVPNIADKKDVIIDLDTAASHSSGWSDGGHHGGHGHWGDHGGNHGHHSAGE